MTKVGNSQSKIETPGFSVKPEVAMFVKVMVPIMARDLQSTCVWDRSAEVSLRRSTGSYCQMF